MPRSKAKPVPSPAPAPTIAELQDRAFKYTADTLRKTPFHVGELDDVAFKRCMDEIVQALVHAWASGYNSATLDRR